MKKLFNTVIVFIFFCFSVTRIIHMEDLNNSAKILLKTNRQLNQNSSQNIGGKTILTIKGKESIKVPATETKTGGNQSQSGSHGSQSNSRQDDNVRSSDQGNRQGQTESGQDTDEVITSSKGSGSKSNQEDATNLPNQVTPIDNEQLKANIDSSLNTTANKKPIFDGNLGKGTNKVNSADNGLLTKPQNNVLQNIEAERTSSSHEDNVSTEDHLLNNKTSQHQSNQSEDEIDPKLNALISGALSTNNQEKRPVNQAQFNDPASEENLKKLLLPKSQGGVVSDEDENALKNNQPTTILGHSIINYEQDPNYQSADPANKITMVVINPNKNNKVKKRQSKPINDGVSKVEQSSSLIHQQSHEDDSEASQVQKTIIEVNEELNASAQSSISNTKQVQDETVESASQSNSKESVEDVHEAIQIQRQSNGLAILNTIVVCALLTVATT